VAVAGEGVGDARAGGLDETLVQRIVETLVSVSIWYNVLYRRLGGWCLTGPVRVWLDLVDHVPMRSYGHVCAAAGAARRSAVAREV